LALTGLFGFECRLGDSTSTADFACRITRLHGGHAVLAGRSATHALPTPWRGHPIWDRLGRFCEVWAEPTSELHANVRELWLEFDVGSAPPADVPVPSVFFAPRAAGDAVDYDSIVDSAIPLLHGAPLPPPIRRMLRVFLNALPAAAAVRHVGLMLPRPTDAVRFVIGDLPFDSLGAFLDRVNLPGASAVHAALLPAAHLAPTQRLMLSFDVGPSIGPRVSLECFVPADLEWSSRRSAFLDYLVDEGLCVPAKRAALVAWHGWVHEPDGNAASPEQLAPLSDLVGLPVYGVFVPGLSHVKVSYEPDRPLEVKAYLAVHLRWKLI
jgi:hypothetical protein